MNVRQSLSKGFKPAVRSIIRLAKTSRLFGHPGEEDIGDVNRGEEKDRREHERDGYKKH